VNLEPRPSAETTRSKYSFSVPVLNSTSTRLKVDDDSVDWALG
jgi:hypothetical protein